MRPRPSSIRQAVLPVIELLDQRRHLSATLTAGSLLVTGTSHDDHIKIFLKSGDATKLEARVNHTTTEFNTGDISEIRIYARGGDDTVSGVISYESDTRPEGDTVDFKQYKVDYTLHGIADVPYFAGRSDLPLKPGASESFTLQVVGSAQRQFVRKAMKGKPVSGTAKLQFAGYDFDNKQVFIDTEFDISFDDIMNADANPDAGADDGP